MWFSLLGLAITIGLNVALVPRMGYMGCAWAAFACYGVMMITSYFVGRAKHPIGYPTARIGAYFVLATIVYVIGLYVAVTPIAAVNYVIRALLLLGYIAVVVKKEKIRIR